MFRTGPTAGGPFGGGLTGPVPRDLAILLGVVLATFALQFFASTAPVAAALRLTPAVWRSGWLWQVLTYPFIGAGGGGIWFVLELLVLFLFGRDVFLRLGRAGTWRLMVGVSVAAGVVAVLTAWATGMTGTPDFALLQGQRALLAILVAAFATLNRDATILLFFVLPVQARWFLGLEVLFAFLGFLTTRDLGGFLGICCAVALTWAHLTPGHGRTVGRRLVLRLQERWMRLRLARLRRRKRMRLVPGAGERPGGRDTRLH